MTVPVLLLISDGPRYTVEAISEWATPVAGPLPPPGVVHQPPSGTARPEGGISLVERMLAHESERVKAAARGESFAPRGERDDALQRVCSTMMFLDQHVSIDDAVAILTPSLQKWAGEEGASLSLAQEQEKSREKLARARADKKRKDDEIRDACRPDQQKVDPPTDDNAARWADQRGRSREQMLKELIIQAGNSYYVFVDGRYKSPITREMLDNSLPRDLVGAPVRWQKMNAKGEMRPRTIPDVLRDHCTVARSVVADLAISDSWYDADAQEFVEAVRPLRSLVPRRSAEVERWLNELAEGSHRDILLDWIALVTRLDRQCAALYLQGPKSTGKTLLAYGLARLWCKGPPADIAGALADFNDDLVRCPLVLADEEIPQRFRSERVTAKVRALIGQESRTLKRKYMPTAHLRGALRLMMCANHSRLLDMSAEDVDEQDVEAIAERVVYVKTPVGAAQYLADIGGPPTVQAWIDEDVIAEHALWLRETRPVAAGQRFGVKSNYASAHGDLATHGRAAAQVLEWLASYLDAPMQVAAKKNLLYCGDGHLYVNAATIREYWDHYLKHHPRPSTDLIGRKLSGMSRGTRRINGRRFHDVRLDVVFGWADRMLGSDVEKMQAFVDRPLQVTSDGALFDTMGHDA